MRPLESYCWGVARPHARFVTDCYALQENVSQFLEEREEIEDGIPNIKNGRWKLRIDHQAWRLEHLKKHGRSPLKHRKLKNGMVGAKNNYTKLAFFAPRWFGD